MSQPATLSLTAVVPESAHREDRARFLQWALAETGVAITQTDGQQWVVDLPESDRALFGDQVQLRLPMSGPPLPGQESLSWDERFGRWALARVQSNGPALNARPQQQPMSVRDVSARLFPAYAVENGQIHLAGCQLTDHPFLRLSYGVDDEQQVRHVYVAPDGSSIDDELVAKLGLDNLETIPRQPPRLEEAALRSLIAAGRRIAARQAAPAQAAATLAEPLAAAVLWVRHAEGRLQFTIGKATAALPFSAWAKLLTPPPFVAAHSGASTYRLAATDDGRIDAAEEIAICAESGSRVLRQDLVQCSATGKLVLPDLTENCPVTGLPALRQEFVDCESCRQRVSRAVLSEGVCEACRSLAKVTKDDARLVWIFGEHPGLDRWKRWRLAETQTVYIAEASGLWKRLLLVVDKETLAVRRAATSDRLSKNWTDASEAAAAELLK